MVYLALENGSIYSIVLYVPSADRSLSVALENLTRLEIRHSQLTLAPKPVSLQGSSQLYPTKSHPHTNEHRTNGRM